MKFFNLDSINKKLVLLVSFAVLPAIVILLFSGIEQRRRSIENAKQDVLMLTHTMAEAQKEIARSTRKTLSILSLLSSIQSMDIKASSEIFKAVLEKNQTLNNITLIDLKGDVIASAKTFTGINLADRKHIRDALEKKDFAVGEYIVSRVGSPDSALPFAYPVLDKEGNSKAILTTAIKLASFAQFHDISRLPEKSFVSITDYKGVRLFYYPEQETTNPIGKGIKSKSWETASKASGPGFFISTGSDSLRRVFAFRQVRLTPEDIPYLYIWAGIPESHILGPANVSMTRNILILLLASGIAFFLSWAIGKKTLVSPIQSLIKLTRKYAEGNLEARSEYIANPDEFGTLTKAFHDMADILSENQSTKNDLIKKLEKSIDEIKTLQGILPICSICKKIRNDEGYYEQIESYIHKHTGVDFSHTICRQCMKERYPEEYDSMYEE